MNATQPPFAAVKPRLLDLFCGAGGAGMGYHRAGFDVVGVDIKPQKNYPFEFHQADAMTYSLEGFDVIHASPPCQGYSSLKGLTTTERPLLINAMRKRLHETQAYWVIENVRGAASSLRYSIELCGSAFGLGVWRHRLFETSDLILSSGCDHSRCPYPIDVTGTGGPFNGVRTAPGGGVSRKPKNLAHARDVMGIDWMTRKELSESIPPAYTEFIGEQILRAMEIAA